MVVQHLFNVYKEEKREKREERRRRREEREREKERVLNNTQNVFEGSM